MADSGKFLQRASARMERKGTKGLFKRAAERAGMSTEAYAEKEKHAGSAKMRKRANFALNAMHANPHRG
jgi:hypothetical protein